MSGMTSDVGGIEFDTISMYTVIAKSTVITREIRSPESTGR
jgi:hypothetical protein